LREYIYLPLGGRRVKWWAVNILVVFLVSGIWHGAGWGFLVWGCLHGMGVIVCGIRPGLLRLPFLRWALTFIYTTFAWLFFLERDPHVLLAKCGSLFSPLAYGASKYSRFTDAFSGSTNALATVLIVALASSALAVEGWGVARGKDPYYFARRPACILTLVFLTVLLAPMEESSFIYFNF
jgi:D-alanyl-lipoteichoic acid acyltransferase DltB (MBOAT superfamily)